MNQEQKTLMKLIQLKVKYETKTIDDNLFIRSIVGYLDEFLRLEN